jgi:hypothetical protein
VTEAENIAESIRKVALRMNASDMGESRYRAVADVLEMVANQIIDDEVERREAGRGVQVQEETPFS